MKVSFIALLLKLSVLEQVSLHQQRYSLIQVHAPWYNQPRESDVILTLALLPCDEQHLYLRISGREQNREGLLQSILPHVSPQTTLQVNEKTYEIESLHLEDACWSGIATWSDIEQAPHGRRMCFHFVTPFLTGVPQKECSLMNVPFPEPVLVFSCLAEQWQQIRGSPLSRDLQHTLSTAGCVLSAYHLSTVPIECSSAQCFAGFRGWVEYECQYPSTAEAAQLAALARLAFFTGLGYLTKQGMGTTTVAFLE